MFTIFRGAMNYMYSTCVVSRGSMDDKKYFQANKNVQSYLMQRKLLEFNDKTMFKRDEIAQIFIPGRLKRDGYDLTALK